MTPARNPKLTCCLLFGKRHLGRCLREDIWGGSRTLRRQQKLKLWSRYPHTFPSELKLLSEYSPLANIMGPYGTKTVI